MVCRYKCVCVCVYVCVCVCSTNTICVVDTAPAVMPACVRLANNNAHKSCCAIPAHAFGPAHKQGRKPTLSHSHSHTHTLTHRPAELVLREMKRQSRGTVAATKEQKPRGKRGEESRMKDRPSSDPQPQRHLRD